MVSVSSVEQRPNGQHVAWPECVLVHIEGLTIRMSNLIQDHMPGKNHDSRRASRDKHLISSVVQCLVHALLLVERGLLWRAESRVPLDSYQTKNVRCGMGRQRVVVVCEGLGLL